MFATPYVDVYTGNPEGQRFPVPAGVSNATPSHPDPNVNWAQYEPISSSPTYYYGNVTPYSESWMLSLQRQLVNTVLTSAMWETWAATTWSSMKRIPARRLCA